MVRGRPAGGPVGTNYAAMLDMKRMFTDDRYHKTWWHYMIRDYPASGLLDFRYALTRKQPDCG